MKKVFLMLIFTATLSLLYAQDFEPPENYKLEKAEDYTLYEKDVINCIHWMMKTPLNENTDKRKVANAFLLKWLTGSPNVHLAIKQEIVTFIGSSPELLIIFMGGWAKYSLESGDFDNMVAGNLAGIESVIEFYTKNEAYLNKDKNVLKYIKMKEKGTLKSYIEKNA
ncbi:MAG: hypothetical protein JXB00_13800 [Bacteroidales bacterium]|nr:hypothetical protein [Bacteroidales bacterium]